MGYSYAITLTKVMPGEPTGQISDLLEDFGFNSIQDAERRFKNIPLSREYIRKEFWEKNTDTKVKRVLREERYNEVNTRR